MPAPTSQVVPRRSAPKTFLYVNILKEARPIVLVLAALRYVAGVFHAPGSTTTLAMVAGGVSWVAVTAGIYLINASSDVEADIINRKDRPLANGLITKRDVDSAATLAMVLAALSAAVAGPPFVPALCVMSLAGVLYSLGPKPGKEHYLSASAIVAIGLFLPYVAGSLASCGSASGSVLTAAAFFGGWAGIACVSKDFADASGDAAAGRRTLPVVVGLRASALVAGLGSIVVALAAFLVGYVGPLHAALWILAFGALAFTIICLAITCRPNPPFPLGTPYRVFMMTQLAANGAMILTAPALLGASL